MRKVFFFMMVSLDGFFEGPQNDISWHVVDDEFNEFAIQQLDSVGTLLFGSLWQATGPLQSRSMMILSWQPK